MRYERMLRLMLIALIFSTCQSALAFELEGEWVVDTDKTLAFNDSNSKISSSMRELIACSDASMSFSKGRFSEHSSKKRCPERYAKFEDFQRDSAYIVVFNDARKAVVKVDLEAGSDIAVINVVADDLVWVYQGGMAPEFDGHVRYYFRRVR